MQIVLLLFMEIKDHFFYHFLLAFLQGCDASVLLNDIYTFTGEKTAFPKVNSLRGFDVIDTIKSQPESSCADILVISLVNHLMRFTSFYSFQYFLINYNKKFVIKYIVRLLKLLLQ